MLRKFLQGGPGGRTAAGAAVLVLLIVFVSNGLGSYESLRERAFDLMLGRVANPAASAPVVVVDIDRSSLERMGQWPWSREQLAVVVTDILAAGPQAVGLDILIDGMDERSPAALARRLAEITGSSAVAGLAAGLADGDALFSAAIKGRPVVQGLALDPDRAGDLPSLAPFLLQGQSDLSGLWEAQGVSGPPRSLAEVSAGLGVLALAGDGDGLIRRVPLFALAGGRLRPGLALETARVARQASTFVLTRGNVLRMGNLTVPFPADATLRLMPPQDVVMARRTISAADVTTRASQAALAGKVVLLGSSAPELGGLRLASGGLLVPSVQRQASAVAQLLTDVQPRRPLSIGLYETAAVVLAAAMGWAAALRLPPIQAGLVALVGAIGWLVGTGLALRGWQVLLDPIAVPLSVLTSFALTGLIVAADSRRREAALRRRFEQHLAPELVTRIAQDPSLLKLAGETREASILFTDVEGFTAMTERSDPATLIRVLDRYLDEMSAIIVAHGGMVEKIVGDGFHGLFNAPLDLPGHADKAVACARAICAFSESFAREPEPRALGFGRTRVGIETGPVIVGDVGGGTRLDYTAYGNAMNTAARLEAANKDLGSAICVGPGTAALLSDPGILRPLGALDVRGRSDPMQVYDLWPDTMSPADRKSYLDAIGVAVERPGEAAAALGALAQSLPDDAALAGLVQRLRQNP